MRARDLDRQIKLEAFASNHDGDPGSGQWSVRHTVYAEQMDESQLRRFVSDQDLASAQRVYRIRYLAEIDPTWRVNDGDEFWRIEGSPEGAGRRTETLLVCSRYDPNERRYQ